jgi:hypothetical protein
MALPIFVLAAAAAAAHGQASSEQARAAGFAQAQQALAADGMQPAPQSMPAPAAAGPSVSVTPEMTQATAAAGQLNLTCLGGGTANKLAMASAWSSGSFSGNAGYTHFSGSTSGSTTVMGTRQQGFGDQVDVRLFGGDDRIRLPRTMLPPVHGGDDGWFKLKSVKADGRAIRASAAVNFMNNPKIFIDRVTGTISISGKAGDYSGQCQAVAAGAAAKF